MKATCRRCGVTVEPERPNDQLALMRLLETHTCELRFDPDDEDTWRWLLVLTGGSERSVPCLDCGFVWRDGCHLTEALAHVETAEHTAGEKMLARQP